MELSNDLYTVSVKVEVMPQPGNYDIVHKVKEININHDVYMARVLRVESHGGDVFTVALLDIVCSGYEPCAVLEEHIVTVILFSSIARIDLDTGILVQLTQCHNTGGLLEIHSIDDGYIIRGEDEIFRYDRNLNQVWRFSGRDILVSRTKDKHFWIDNGMIHCRDFEGWHYVLNFDGKIIDDFLESEFDETL